MCAIKLKTIKKLKDDYEIRFSPLFCLFWDIQSNTLFTIDEENTSRQICQGFVTTSVG